MRGRRPAARMLGSDRTYTAMMELERLASSRAAGARRFRRSGSYAARVLALFALLSMALVGKPALAQPAGAFPELRSLVLAPADIPGYTVDASRTAANERPDGSGTYDVVFVREGSAGSGSVEVRLAAARTSSGVESMQSLAATREALLAAGWSNRVVPLLGDEAVGFEANGTAVVGEGNVGYG